ncbi:VanZ family protein [Wenzhouxiangella sp. XN24]|uniref:VanZ family protein n=1 Tax=Wenzhouxiangella sp. XN24 TaxID=2713569 RepID=UPI001F105063|nr:VanZ family protein [Wenzhouxiangella sp. XN24]
MPRYRPLWLALGWLMLLTVAVGSLVPSVPAAAAQVSDKLMHFLAYAALAFVFVGASGRRKWPRFVLGLLLLGAAIELAQGLLVASRASEWLDMAANAGGVAAGTLAALAIPGNWCRHVERRLGFDGQGA